MVTDILSQKIVLKFYIHNNQLPSDDGHVTSKQVSMFKIQQQKKLKLKLKLCKLFNKKLTHD